MGTGSTTAMMTISSDDTGDGNHRGDAIPGEALTMSMIGTTSSPPPTQPEGKHHGERTAFERLPQEIIEQILYSSDPNTFASLILLNRQWHQTAQLAHLFAHQLSNCSNEPGGQNRKQDSLSETDLPRLRRRFASEAKRKLFEVFLRPRETTVKLLSTSASSYASFPGGEAFQFSFSPNGRFVLAYGSSRIYVVDLSSRTLAVTRELKVLRRPASAVILDDASQLAVLSSDHQVHLYDLKSPKARLIRSIDLDNPPRSIALAPGGSVLAAAYDGGIEIYAVSTYAMSTERRSVKCHAVDTLTFSSDGALLLGSSLHSAYPHTIALSAPYYNETGRDMPLAEILSQIWTTEILFPNASLEVSHAALLPISTDDESRWIVIHDHFRELLRLVRSEDLKNGKWKTVGCSTGDSLSIDLQKAAPTVTQSGELLATVFAGKSIRLYGIPRKLNAEMDPASVTGVIDDEGVWVSMPGPGDETGSSASQGSEAGGPVGGNEHVPEASSSSDPRCRSTNPLIPSCNLGGECEGISAVHWSAPDPFKSGQRRSWERLVVAAPRVMEGITVIGNEEAPPMDGGRLIIYDFEGGVRNGTKEEITIEVGSTEAELLEEEYRDMEEEVALVRRRTISRSSSTSVGGHPPSRGSSMSASSIAEEVPVRRAASIPNDLPLSRSRSALHPSSATAEAARRSQAIYPGAGDELSLEEVQEALDGPYSHSAPRSRTTLHRAATLAATSHRPAVVVPQRSGSGELRPNTLEGFRNTPPGEIPHESDGDNWVPPPPPYKPDAEQPLPDHLRQTLLPQRSEPAPNTNVERPRTPRGAASLEGFRQSALQRTRTTLERAGNSLRGGRSFLRREDTTDQRSVSPVSSEGSSTHRAPTQSPQPTMVPSRPRTSDDYAPRDPSSLFQSTVVSEPLMPRHVNMPVGSAGPIRPTLTSPFSSTPGPSIGPFPQQVESPLSMSPTEPRFPDRSDEAGDSHVSPELPVAVAVVPAAVQEPPIQGSPSQETPVQSTSLQETPIQSISFQETPLQRTSVPETPVQRTSVSPVREPEPLPTSSGESQHQPQPRHVDHQSLEQPAPQLSHYDPASPEQLATQSTRYEHPSPEQPGTQSTHYAHPSPEQLATLSKRSSRPRNLGPSRPQSAVWGQGFTAPLAAQGAISQARPSRSLESLRSASNPSRAAVRNSQLLAAQNLSSPNISRPSLLRLETIQSVTSHPLPHAATREGAGTRPLSPALEGGEGRRKTWRDAMEGKRGHRDGLSRRSLWIGARQASNQSDGAARRDERAKKEPRCVVM